ncbi:MAG TPA: DeoR/GlpR transcriptional regulator, partial [Pirellulales bacterium]|nr:DeoR/GlpR transcriptional regulator [Pirellulales bacterium]
LGPYANEMLAHLSVRRTLLSVAGINERGFYNSNVLLVETERAMLSAADEVIVLADSTKFGIQSLAHLCPLDAIDYLVVDSGISTAWRRKIEATKVKLLVADQPQAAAHDLEEPVK